jgi:hypothetical protein
MDIECLRDHAIRLRFSVLANWLNRKRRTCAAEVLNHTSFIFQSWIQRIAQTIAEEIQRKQR